MILFNLSSLAAYKNKLIFAVVLIVVFAVIADTSLIKTSVLITTESGSSTRIDLFIAILLMIIIGQFLILAFVRWKTSEIREKNKLHINTIHKIITISQCILTVILVIIILQIILTSQYNINLLIAATAISYSLAILMMGLLTERFISWFRSNKNLVVLSFGLASAMVITNIVDSIFLIGLTLPNSLPQKIVPHLGENIPFLVPGSTSDILYSAYNSLSILSFMIMWVATSLLMRHYSQRFGKIKFWVIVSIPMMYFLSQFITFSLSLFTSLLWSQSILYGTILTLAYTFSKPAGGILFAIAFWLITRNVSQRQNLRDYMIISAYGLVLLFSSNQASVLLSGPYPPFGLAAASFVGLSSYLVLIGIYSSALSVAQDTKLRRVIKKSTIEESKLLISIGSAQMEQEIERRAVKVAKERQQAMAEQTGVQSSLSEH